MEDYRAYLRDYGDSALHYAEAQAFVVRWVADSTAAADSLARVMQETLALAQARQQAEADSIAQAEAERKEETAYGKCTTVAGCSNYLKTYPNGRYVEEVRAKKAELEAQAKPKDVSDSVNGHEWVDLGLPSGTLWATCNVGASSPEDYGSFFAWGETCTKSTYNWDNYKYANGTSFEDPKLTKYCSQSEYGNNGFTDNLTTLQAGDDPATAKWGSGWRTPSKTQWEELLSNTTRKWTTQNGKKGYLFTSKKNGQSVFLPTAGGRWYSDLDSYGDYWSRSLYTDTPSYAWYLYFVSADCDMDIHYRSDGLSVRPVRAK